MNNKTMGKDIANPIQREQFIKDNADACENKGYMKAYTPEEPLSIILLTRIGKGTSSGLWEETPIITTSEDSSKVVKLVRACSPSRQKKHGEHLISAIS